MVEYKFKRVTLISKDGDTDLMPLLSWAQALLYSDIDDCLETVVLIIRTQDAVESNNFNQQLII